MTNNEKQLIREKLENIVKSSISYECQLVAMLWKQPDLYFEYYDNIVKKIIKSKIWKFYLELGNKIVCSGFKHLDEISVQTFLKDRKEDKENFDAFGGYDEIDIVISNVNIDNLEVYIDKLKKYSILYNYISKMTVTKEGIEKLIELENSDDIANFLEIKLSGIIGEIETSSINKNIGKLNEGLEEIITQANEGNNMGLPIQSPILSNEICGLRLGEIILVGGFSGSGKSTLTQEIYLSSIWENKESAVIFLNEQDIVKWKQQFLTWVINNIILKDTNKRFRTKRWLQGKFTQEELEWLDKASKILNEKMEDNLIIIEELNHYTPKEVMKSIKKYAKLGIKYFVLDTFKVSADYSSNADGAIWFSMQEDMRKFYDLVKPSNLNISFWVTLQLEKGSVIHRYLGGNNIGMSKNITDCAGIVLLMRNLRNDEYDSGRNKIEVLKPIDGVDDYRSGTNVILSDESQKYNIIFIEKNRNGRSQEFQIVSKQNLGTLEYEEVGITSIPFGT